MVNQFLATLDGSSIRPDGVVWPTDVVDAPSSVLRSALFGNTVSRQHNFLKALQLLMLVEESTLVGEITADDSRVTYTRSQVVQLLSSYGVAVQSVGTTTTSAVNLQVLPQVEYSYYDIYTADGLTYRVSNERGIRNTTVSFGLSGVSGNLATPDTGATLTITGGQPPAHSAWRLSYWNPGVPLATTLVQTFDIDAMRSHVRSDLLALYDRSPLRMEKIAAAIVSLGRP